MLGLNLSFFSALLPPFATFSLLILQEGRLVMPLSTMQKIYLAAAPVAATPSIIMYLAVPGGTVQHFGGQPSNSSKFWCSTAASGDALVVYLCLVALLDGGKTPGLFKTVVRGNVLYGLFHFGAFWYWHLYGSEPHPTPLMYPISLAVCAAAMAAWGI